LGLTEDGLKGLCVHKQELKLFQYFVAGGGCFSFPQLQSYQD
jgi:hypothetical protein